MLKSLLLHFKLIQKPDQKVGFGSSSVPWWGLYLWDVIEEKQISAKSRFLLHQKISAKSEIK